MLTSPAYLYIQSPIPMVLWRRGAAKERFLGRCLTQISKIKYEFAKRW